MNLEIIGGAKTIVIMIVVILFIIVYYELTIGKSKRQNIKEWLKTETK